MFRKKQIHEVKEQVTEIDEIMSARINVKKNNLSKVDFIRIHVSSDFEG